jgi:hypothetical protein
MPWRAPRLLIQLQRLLWMCAAIIPTVRRGTPGTGLDQTAGGRFSTRKIVARLLVRHAATTLSACAGFGMRAGSAASAAPLLRRT